jgi:hypothetical protein
MGCAVAASNWLFACGDRSGTFHVICFRFWHSQSAKNEKQEA